VLSIFLKVADILARSLDHALMIYGFKSLAGRGVAQPKQNLVNGFLTRFLLLLSIRHAYTLSRETIPISSQDHPSLMCLERFVAGWRLILEIVGAERNF